MEKKTLHKISYGLYVVSSRSKDKVNGQIANAVFQASADPPTLAVSLNKENLTHDYVKQSKKLNVSILSQDAPMELIGKFGFNSGRTTDKFDRVEHKMGANNIPIVLQNSVGYVSVEVEAELDAYTHTIFLGRIVDAGLLGGGAPLTYEFYHDVKKGKSPKNAPTYLGEEEGKKTPGSGKYQCGVCGYIYDPNDPSSDTPGVPFEELPDDWCCPMCGAAKSQFSPVN